MNINHFRLINLLKCHERNGLSIYVTDEHNINAGRDGYECFLLRLVSLPKMAQTEKSTQYLRSKLTKFSFKEIKMRFLATFKKSCSFERWLKLVDDLKPHMDKHGLKLIVAMQSDDGTKIYDLGETETMEGVEAFVSDPDVIRMRKEAGVDTDSQEVINSIGDYHIFPS